MSIRKSFFYLFYTTLCMTFFLIQQAFAQAQFLQRKAEGWHYYETIPTLEKKEKEKEEEPKIDVSQKKTDSSDDPIKKLEKFQQEIKRLKAQAVMEPTFENVQAYMQIQQQMMSKSSAFAQKWMEVVYTTPSLDYTAQHPTSQAGRHVYLEQKNLEIDLEVQKLSQIHGLFFFFSEKCAYCKQFAPIVKAFSKKYGWDVIAISMDGGTSEEFPDAVPDNGIASKLGVQHVPTLLAVNPMTEEVIPLSHGMSSQDQILDRIRVLILNRRPS